MHWVNIGQNPRAILADLAAMLLSNLTASAAACSTMLALKVPIISSATPYYPTQSRCGTCLAPTPYPSGEPRDVLALPLMIDAFVQGARMDSGNEQTPQRKGQLHFLASVFANLTVVSTLLPRLDERHLMVS
jgi:hypothetical protein